MPLFDVLGAMELAVPPDERARARALLIAPRGEWEDEPIGPGLAPAAVILDGVVLRTSAREGRVAGELLGAGDLIDLALPHHAVGPVCAALLDDGFRLACRRWPGLHEALQQQLLRQLRRSSQTVAMLHLARVEDRLAAAFRDIGERWGRVTAEGIVVEVPLTHELLGRLVGSRRPTVSLALTALADRGLVVRRDDRSWLLATDLLPAPA